MPYFHAQSFFIGLLAIVVGVAALIYGTRSGMAQTQEADLLDSLFFPWLVRRSGRLGLLYFRATYILGGTIALTIGIGALFASLVLPEGRQR